jgi:glycosyltransferase involved in cell wall biosynthesis
MNAKVGKVGSDADLAAAGYVDVNTKLLIFESAVEGHCQEYLRLLAPAIGATAPAVFMLPASSRTEAPELASFLRQYGEVDEAITAHPPRGLSNVLVRIRSLLRGVTRHRPTHVILPTADLVLWLGLAAIRRAAYSKPSWECELVIHNCGLAYRGRTLRVRLIERAFRIAALYGHHPIRIHFLDETALEWARRTFPWIASRMRLLPEPIERPATIDRTQARAALGLDTTARVIGCAGTLSRRKGIDLLLAAFADAERLETDTLLLVGRADEEIRQLLRLSYGDLIASGRIIVRDGFVPIQDLMVAISAMDVVCTPYPQHSGIASILLRAIASNRSVLSSDFGWVARMTNRLDLGRTCNVRDPRAFATAIAMQLDAAGRYRQSDAARSMLEFNSSANFREALLRYLTHDAEPVHGSKSQLTITTEPEARLAP